MKPETILRLRRRSGAAVRVVAAVVAAACIGHSWANSLADAPLFTASSTAVNPNLMFILTDSGSMQWDFMPDEADMLNRTMFGRVQNITLRVDNLLDAKYRDATSRIKDFTFNPGRNVSLVYKLYF